jgi:hypothetical protein
MLVSAKILKPGFLKTKIHERYINTENFGPCSFSELRQAVIRAVKFVVGRELLSLEATLGELINFLYGSDAQPGQLIPESKKEKLFTMWAQFSKMPYSEIFIENSSGGILLQDTESGIVCTTIYHDGEVSLQKALIAKEATERMEFARTCIGFELAQVSNRMGEEGEELIANMVQNAKLTGLVILNALTYINAKNVSIEPYRLSRNEAKSNRISNVLLSSYSYHVVDIFHKTKKYHKLIEVEAFAEMKMSSNVRAHMVRGHFKQKQSGLYWWNSFLRYKKNEGFINKNYIVH